MNNFRADTSYFEKSKFGLTFSNDRVLVFFGNQTADLESLKNVFPEITFQKVKQTHSDLVVESSPLTVEADSHYTSHKNTGLLISTADCLPVMVYCHQTHRVASIHAGWKGVSNQIVLKTLNRLNETGSSENNFEIWIGPHILQNSFEIDIDVLKQLELSTYRLNRNSYAYEEKNKYYVDLNKIVASQIATVAGSDIKIHSVAIDTKNNTEYCSFRRDRDKAGRNLSFIYLLKEELRG